MHRTTVIAAIWFVAASTSASAQEWIEFASREDGFTCNFPGQPTITETTFRSQFGPTCRRGSIAPSPAPDATP